jgi:hypothetical protein
MATSHFSIKAHLDRVYANTTPRFQFNAESKEEWAVWHRNLKEKLVELLGGFPPNRCPLRPEILERVEEETYWREKVVFESLEDVSIPAYLLIPKGIKDNGKAKALLCLHGHGRGKDDVVGIVSDEVDRQQNIRPLNYDYARQFAERGYVVLAPDAMCFGERGDISCAWAFTSGLLLGEVLVGLRVWDAMRAMDYLESRPEVDAQRIGCVGLSWGGTHTIYTSALDERIKVAVVSGYFSSFKDILIDRACCSCQYVPNILKYADLPDIVSLIAPRPLLIENGTRDPLYTLEVVKKEYPRVEKVYHLLEGSDRVDIDLFDGSHRFSGEKAFDWFDQWL